MKLVTLKNTEGQNIRCFQRMDIDEVTRIRVIKIYQRHNQKNTIDFINQVIDRFPFRIHTIRTNHDHEFHSQSHWHAEDKGMRHEYVKPDSPQLNGKV